MKRWMLLPIAAAVLLGGCGSGEDAAPGAVTADEARMLNDAEAMLGEINLAEEANDSAAELNAAP